MKGKGAPFLVLALILVLGSLASAQTETVLHTFTNGSDGGYPQQSALLPLGGSFYGVTLFGGQNSFGTIFQLSQDSSGNWQETVLYSFTGGSDGQYPLGALIADRAGNLYGVTNSGGAQGAGVVFEWEKSSAQLNVLHAFGSGFDGQNPQGPLLFDASGNLYGTTVLGGGLNSGTVYELFHSNGAWTEAVLHNFGESGDGSQPYGALVHDSAGNLYGTTQVGGTNSCAGLGCGIAFQLVHTTSGWTENILHQFQGGADGYYPRPITIDKNGNLFGATEFGGGQGTCSAGPGVAPGCGTVYELSQAGNGTWTETVLHRFGGGFGGSEPSSVLMIDSLGNLYGETGLVNSDNGMVFRLARQTGGSWPFKVLFIFDGTDGSNPEGGLRMINGVLYGTTIYGGTYNSGVAFSLKP